MSITQISERSCTILEANLKSKAWKCTSLKDFGSEGSNGYYTRVNPVQPGPG